MKRLHKEDNQLERLTMAYQALVEAKKSLPIKETVVTTAKVAASAFGVPADLLLGLFGLGTTIAGGMFVRERKKRKSERITFGQASPEEADRFRNI